MCTQNLGHENALVLQCDKSKSLVLVPAVPELGSAEGPLCDVLLVTLGHHLDRTHCFLAAKQTAEFGRFPSLPFCSDLSVKTIGDGDCICKCC